MALDFVLSIQGLINSADYALHSTELDNDTTIYQQMITIASLQCKPLTRGPRVLVETIRDDEKRRIISSYSDLVKQGDSMHL